MNQIADGGDGENTFSDSDGDYISDDDDYGESDDGDYIPSIYSTLSTGTESGRFVCSQCHSDFKKQRYLNRHMLSVHKVSYLSIPCILKSPYILSS